MEVCDFGLDGIRRGGITSWPYPVNVTCSLPSSVLPPAPALPIRRGSSSVHAETTKASRSIIFLCDLSTTPEMRSGQGLARFCGELPAEKFGRRKGAKVKSGTPTETLMEWRLIK